jgi:tRNA-Thr(GGU) m(6)t(6)A37 methyltransferase TsaA
MSSVSNDTNNEVVAAAQNAETSLPQATTGLPASLVQIGRIHTPYRTIEACPRHGAADNRPAILELFAEYEPALLGIESASHVYVFYWLNQANRDALHRRTPHDGIIRGVFATRSPARPNPIGLSVAKLIEWDRSNITVSALDCINGTPLIDIKPYIPLHDCIPEAFLQWLG